MTIPKKFVLHRSIEVPLIDTVGGEGMILAHVLTASEWLQFQIDLDEVPDNDMAAFVRFTVLTGRSWIEEVRGVYYDNGTPLTAADADSFPPAVHKRVFDAVTGHVAVGKSKGSVSSSVSAPNPQSGTTLDTSASTAQTEPVSVATVSSNSDQVSSATQDALDRLPDA